MCIAVPSKIISIDNDMAVVDVDGVQREVCILLLEDVNVNDYVIVHAGFAINKLDETSAKESLLLLRQALNPENKE